MRNNKDSHVDISCIFLGNDLLECNDLILETTRKRFGLCHYCVWVVVFVKLPTWESALKQYCQK